MRQCIEKGLVDGKITLPHSAHAKADASFKVNVKVLVERKTIDYIKRLDRYEEAENIRNVGSYQAPARTAREMETSIGEENNQYNMTDPDAGMLRHPGKPLGIHYLRHQSVDAAHGIVVDGAVTAGNVNDLEPYLERVEYMCNHIGLNIQDTGADTSYGTSLIYHEMKRMGIRLHTPKSTDGETYKAELKREHFRYDDEENDYFVCP